MYKKLFSLELPWNSYLIFTYQVTRQNEYRNNENPNLEASKDNSNCRKCCLWQILSSWSNIGLLLYPTKISFIFRNNPATFQAFNWEKITKFFHSWLKNLILLHSFRESRLFSAVMRKKSYTSSGLLLLYRYHQVCFYATGT